MTPLSTTARGLVAALALALTLAAASGAAPAGAHEGGGTLTVEQVHPGGLSVHYIVLVTWENDGHPAADATVTATAVGSDGTALTPVTLAPSGTGDGRYAGSVTFPEAGAWTVRFTSIEPTGSAERPEQVTAPDTGAEGTDGSGDAGATATSEPGVALADDGTGASAAQDDGGDGGMPVLLIVAAAVVAVGGVVTALLAIRRHRPDLEAGTTEPGNAGPDAGTTEPGNAGPDAGTTEPGVAATGADPKGGDAEAPSGPPSS
jgi:hypothetical protein